jgi:hypothetical protein
MIENKMKDTIKIGIILKSENVPLWIYRVIENIFSSEFAEIRVLIHNYEKIDRSVFIKSIIYRHYKKLDRFIIRNRIDYNKIVNLSEILRGIIKISVNSSFSKNKLDNIYREISMQNLDIILDFSSLTFNESYLKLAKYGIWQYRIDNTTVEKAISNVYWKLVKKDPVIEVVLRSSHSSLKKEIILYRSWIPTNFNSIHINLDHVYGLFLLIIQRLIKDIYLNGLKSLNDLNIKYEKTGGVYDNKLVIPPSNIMAFINMLIITFRYFLNHLVYKNKLKWFLMYKFDINPFPDQSKSYKVLTSPEDRFWADPFVICRNNKIFIFVEEFFYSKNKGHITLLELDKSGNISQNEKILEKSYHMSYPFLFEFNNNFYMIPETYENKTIELYKCEEFPRKWNFVMNLMENILAADTTIFFYKNKWWLFASINESLNFPEYGELFLYYSNDLFTKGWIPHPKNPIVTDIRSSRPAGRIFIHENKIYRPSQDCSGRYGRAFNLNQIITLTETSYEEVLISKTEADWEPKLKGTHTYNFDKNFKVIDAYKFSRRFNF